MLTLIAAFLSWALLFETAAADAPVEEMAGRWKHDQGRSDQHYIGPEYPGRWMEIVVRSDELEIEQALGGVKNGFPTPGSGDTQARYTLPTDGEEHEVTTGDLVRAVWATWQQGSLVLQSKVSLGGEGSLSVHETWRLIDEGASLEIERVVTLNDRSKTRRIVFRRQASE